VKLAIEFALVILFLVLPPILWGIRGMLQGATAYRVDPLYPVPDILARTFYAVWLYYLYTGTKSRKTQGTHRIPMFALTLAAVALSSLVFQGLSRLLPLSTPPEIIGMSIPGYDPWFIANNIIGTAIFAFFEELLYRTYLPSRLLNFRLNKYTGAALSQGLFAIAHISMGPWGVLNALVCGLSLQLCYQKTKSLTVITAIHILYNLAGRAWLFRFAF
jgi:membrane protease YdiL (CAAX protease family)